MSEIYTDDQVNKLEKYENILDKMVDGLSSQYDKTKDPRTARLLLETVTTSTESIHKTASNKLKLEANKGNDDVKILVATMLKEIADKNKNPVFTVSMEDKFIDIEVPIDIVDGEAEIGVGFMSLEDLKRPKVEDDE